MEGVKPVMLNNISMPTIVWFILMVVFIVTEVGTYQLVSIWFALGAIAAMLSSLFNVSGTMQLVIFAVVSMVSLIASRPLVKKMQKGPKEKTNADRAIGQTAKVILPINSQNKGRVELDGVSWAAAVQNDQDSFAVGEYVKVVRIEGVTLYVEKGQ